MYVSVIVSVYVRSCVCVCRILMCILWTHIVRSWECRAFVHSCVLTSSSIWSLFHRHAVIMILVHRNDGVLGLFCAHCLG